MSKRKSECTPEEWANYREKERLRKKKLREANPEKAREKNQEYAARYRERYPEKHRERTRKKYERRKARNPEAVNSAQRGWRAKNREKVNAAERARRYGASDAALAALLKAQGDKCAICGVDINGFDRTATIDHCHASGAVRGVLCAACNKGLGFFKDSTASLSRAVEYLQNPPAAGLELVG